MCALVHIGAAVIDDLEVGLMHERRGIERSTARLPRDLAVGDGAQFVIQERHKPVERLTTAAPQLAERVRTPR
jgi:hypothetical protein